MEHGKSQLSTDDSRQGPGPTQEETLDPLLYQSTLGSHSEGTLFGRGTLKLSDLGF